ncbi:hypothetical protein ACIO6T_36305 [Streptomyces sp. NPDC087532]|uniref:hypothetical protein n=1 Tax=Streptomyces sp. NPDC087532 TaxID=3365795 RepID=UPI0038096008
MTMQRRRAWWLGVLVVLALLAGGGVAFWKIQESDTRLAIEIKGLPGNARSAVTVTGAGGFKRSVTTSTTVEVPPGSVRVTPAPFKAAHATYYTSRDVLTATVDSGESARLIVDYQIAVADKARILDHTNPGLAKSTTGEDQELLFRADTKSAQNLKTGDILLAAEGPQTPKGLLRRVVRIEHRKSVLAAETAPAQLQEAMPKTVLRFPAARKGSATASDVVPAAYAADPPIPKPETEATLKIDTWKGKVKGGQASCGINHPLFKAEGEWPSVDLTGTDMGFNETDLVWAQLQAKIKYSLKTTWGTPHSAHCSWEWEEGLEKTHVASAMTAVLARVGPFTVRPELSVVGGVEAQAATGLKVESKIENEFTVKSRLTLKPFATAHIEDKDPVKYESKLAGATEGKLKGKVGFRVKLVAGVPLDVFATEFFLEFGTGVEGSIEPLNRKAKVEGFIEGGAGMEVTAGEFVGRQVGMTIPLYKVPLWERKIPPTLAYATHSSVEVRTGEAGPDRVAPIPPGMAARQLAWSPNGKQLAWSTAPTRSGHDEGRIYLADLATGKVGSWECGSCRLSFAGDVLLSEWDTLGGEEAGFARYRIGQEEPTAVHLENPATLHRGQTREEVWEVARKYCGTGGCATMDLYGEAASSGDSLIGIPWNDCRPKLFRVNSLLQASALTVANAYPDAVESGPDGRLLLSGVNSGGCDGLGKPGHLEFSEVSKTGQLSTVPVPSHYQSWEPCNLWYDEEKNPHAVLAPPMDDGDVLTAEYPCFQQPPRKFRTLKKQGDAWEESGDAVLLRRTRGDWSAELHVGGRLTAENSSRRFRVSERVRTFAWGPGAP